ncbi:MAG: sulfatase-like hydrolase/transferase [Phaeodactylibacter sp.]|uniref:sulfatase family protein n=1 Tax=Phaeodactylibacter sp. TaxID=1940289 RepID=UPI0032EFD191
MRQWRGQLTDSLFGLSLAYVALWLGGCGEEHSPSEQKEKNNLPNIVLVVADDLGYGALGAYGSKAINTPNLDKVAAQGSKLTQFYVSSPVCSPSRASILSGMQPWEVNVPKVLMQHRKSRQEGISTKIPLLPTLLKQQNYQSCLIGKWHLGYEAATSPLALGFDEFTGFIGGRIDYNTYHSSNGIVGLLKNGQPVEADGVHLTQRLTTEAVEYVTAYDLPNPYFLMLAYANPHKPYILPEGNPVNEQSSPIVKYQQMVALLDEQIGALLNVIWEKDPNTLFVFISDHGAPSGVSSNGSLSGGKGLLLEGGLRVPAIMYWPGKIEGGLNVDEPHTVFDLFQTLLSAASCRPNSASGGIPIFDFNASTSGTKFTETEDPRLLYWDFGGTKAIRKGRYKAVFIPRQTNSIRAAYYLNQAEPKVPEALMHQFQGYYPLLFDLEADPEESRNLVLEDTDRAKAMFELMLSQQ